MTRTLLVVSHPRADSLTRAVAGRLADIAREAGELTVHDLDADDFDPRLTAEESAHVREGTPDDDDAGLVAQYRRDLRSATQLVVVHPNWWGKPPALVSGWLDRVLAPGVAYKLTGGAAGRPEGLLDLSALVVTLGDTPVDREVQEFGDPLADLWLRCVLPFVGAHTAERLHLTPVNAMTEGERAAALDRCEAALRAHLDGTR